MAQISSIDKLKFEKLFDMGSGYVLNFSNRTFSEYFRENAGVDILSSKYDYASGSKANRLRAFWITENNVLVGRLLSALLDYWKWMKSSNNQVITQAEQALFEECKNISDRLKQNIRNNDQQEHKSESQKKQELKEKQINQLLLRFEELAHSSDHQRRGFALEDLLNGLFSINEIPVVSSFKRNSGGEQIDGAFSFHNWHYLVECKWTTEVSDIHDLDSLLGKVNRSGKQTMGLFLSIDGWSENVPLLLRQNPDKCIILMEGYDLRCVLSGAVELEELLSKKIAKLNVEANPYYSAAEMMGAK